MHLWDYPVFQPRNFLAGVVLGVVIVGTGYIMWNQSNKIDYVAATPMPTPTPSPESDQISMILVGDIMLSRQVGEKIAASGDWRYPFLRIKDFLESADLAVANIENPISNRGIRVGSIYSFRADPRTLAGLKYAGIDIVSLANNHIWDYGREAFLDTMSNLKNEGIEYIGAGYDFDEAHRGIIKIIKGTRITFLAYTDLLSKQLNATAAVPGVAIYDRDQMIVDITAAKAKSDIVIVSFHGGTEYETHHSVTQEQIYTTAIDAGADLVVGHHPHVIQEVLKHKNGWIAYSLGNFIFDQSFSAETMEGIALKVIVNEKKISKVESIPIGISSQSQAYLQ